MKKFISYILLSLNILTFWGNGTQVTLGDNIKCNAEASYYSTCKQDLLTLMMAYPEYISGVETTKEGIYIVTTKNKRIIYDDMQGKNIHEKINNSDVQDILEDIYSLEMPKNLQDINSDPGRFRCYSLLNAVYGSGEAEVKSNLTGVYAPYIKYQFNKNNGAAEALGNAMKELKDMASENSKIGELTGTINGTFNYRVIAGTNNLSPHAYGIAIDIASNPSDYWKWASREAGEKRVLYYPEELVKTFEKYNFVWGGKWGHFDTLHFEYRPEILIKARYFSEPIRDGEMWYKQVPIDERTQGYINIIEDALN